jgi:hypothetical protein
MNILVPKGGWIEKIYQFSMLPSAIYPLRSPGLYYYNLFPMDFPPFLNLSSLRRNWEEQMHLKGYIVIPVPIA